MPTRRSSSRPSRAAAAAAAASPSSDKENVVMPKVEDEDENANNANANANADSPASVSGTKRDRSENTQAGAAGLLSMSFAAGGGEEEEGGDGAHKEEEEHEEEEGEREREEGEDPPQAQADTPTRQPRAKRSRRGRAQDLIEDEQSDEDQDEEEEEYHQEDEEEEEEEELEEDGDDDDDDDDGRHAASAAASSSARSPARRTRPSPAAALASPLRHVNPAGKPAEAGIIHRVYVENFMCHRKLTVDLCRNVNFIHGQNGSGKSAILAAIQICLGAGAKRTHRARNLKELVRKESGQNCPGAKVRVTLLNRGSDGYQRDVYGDYVTVERSISLRGGYNGYKLLDANLRERSRSKKDLDAMLDQLNIQVENPVAVLDQEEAKKFLTGKPEDKYQFFTKATELERLDRSYATIADNIEDLSVTNDRVRAGLRPAKETVQTLKKEWEAFQELDALEDKVADQKVNYAWSVRNELQDKADVAEQTLKEMENKLAKRQQDLEKAEAAANVTDDQEQVLGERMKQLTEEATEAEAAKRNLETELKQAEHPIKKIERELKELKKREKKAQKELKTAARHLQDARDEILAKAGNKESEEAQRTARMEKAERDLADARKEEQRVKVDITESLEKYESMAPDVEQAKEDSQSVASQHGAVKMKISDLKKDVGNNLAMFGQKAVAMHQRVEDAKRRRKFTGPVVGPIGIHIKIAQGKEHLAKIAELALGGGALDRYIVTNDADRALFMKLRENVGCSSRDCNVFQEPTGDRFNVIRPPDGVETVATVLNIEDYLVYNCLVNNCRIDQAALSTSKEDSEGALLVKGQGGRESIKGGNIKQVYFLPQGDCWSVDKMGKRSMISNEKQLRQTIGVDRTAATREAERDLALLDEEVKQARDKLKRLQQEELEYKRTWNKANSQLKKYQKKITDLETTIDDIKAEADNAENVTIDTTELEEDVKAAEEAIEEIKAEEGEKEASIEDLHPGIEEVRNRLEETTARNEKVLADLVKVEKQMEDYVKGHSQRQAAVEKKQKKVQQIEEILAKQGETVSDVAARADDAMRKARLLAFKRDQDKERHHAQQDGEDFEQREPSSEDLEAIEAVRTNKTPAHYKAKIEQGMKKIEREKERRKLTESDPEVAYQKYQRAKTDLESKLEQVEHIRDNIDGLLDDAKDRKRRWKQFRSHIETTTNSIFDELLNRKGSSGQLEFDHDAESLNLCVQKDNANEMSQTKDVKALSGGERSFTTLSLLLALGENLETPFRVMDEFDVFLDPVSRKIALTTMVEMAKDMEHRQFIFITPQDVSSLKTDPMLKIFGMKNPKRSEAGGAQQTLAFGSPSQSQE